MVLRQVISPSEGAETGKEGVSGVYLVSIVHLLAQEASTEMRYLKRDSRHCRTHMRTPKLGKGNSRCECSPPYNSSWLSEHIRNAC